MRLLFIFLGIIIFYKASAQRKHWFYCGEYQISSSDYSNTNIEGSEEQIVRLSVFPNIQVLHNVDMNNHAGFMGGFSINNLGLIYKDSLRHKARILTIGIPVYFKIGSFRNNRFFYLGSECEYALHLKQKHFLSRHNKNVSSDFLPEQVNALHPSIFWGYFMNDKGIKLKYYFRDFFNTAYRNSMNKKPFHSVKSKPFFISLVFAFGKKQKPSRMEENNKHYQTKFAINN